MQTLQIRYRLKTSIPLLLVIIFACCVPLFTGNQALTLIIPALLWGVACMGLTLIARAGQVSMGQAGFMAIGAYSATLLALRVDVPFGLNILLGGIISGIVAFLIGRAVLRLGGMYFAIVTLAFGEVVRVIAINARNITNGVYGLTVPQPQISIGGYVIAFAVTKAAYYYLSLGLVIIAALIFWRLDVSRLGRVVRSISSTPELSQHLGIHVMKYRLIAFTVACTLTGVAGGVYCHFLAFMGPTVFVLSHSILILIMSAVGGLGSAVAGPILGAMILSPLGDYLRTVLVGARPLIFGGLVVIVMFFLPGGLVTIVDRIRSGGRRGTGARNAGLKNAVRNLVSK